MNWLNIAYGFVFFCNLLFMVGALYVLLRVLDATEKSHSGLQKAASQIIEVGTHVKVAVRRAFNEMDRANDAQTSKENATGRAITELSFQIKTLLDRLAASLKKAGAGAAGDTPAPATAEDIAEALRDKLHAELQAALHQNHRLQDEIAHTHDRLNSASSANTELREEITGTKGIKQSVVDQLVQRTTELEEQLTQARARAKAAEKLAEDNACQLDDIRAQISEQQFAASVAHLQPAAAPTPGAPGTDGMAGIDQSELIQSQQDQIDVLSAREKSLSTRIAQLEGELSRNLDEKHFIEDRFLQLDANHAAPDGAAPAP